MCKRVSMYLSVFDVVVYRRLFYVSHEVFCDSCFYLLMTSPWLIYE